RDAHVLARPVVRGLSRRLHLQRADEDDPIAFLQPALHFRIVEIALAELEDARREVLVGRVGRDKDEPRARAALLAAELRRRRQLAVRARLRAALRGACRAAAVAALLRGRVRAATAPVVATTA